MLTQRTFRVLAVACLACTAPSFAPAAATPESPPAPTVGGSDDISALVQRLGDADFRVREAAGRKLREIGKPAMPALQEALTCGDPEICSRADSLLRQIERPRIPAGWFSDFTGWRRNESLRNGSRIVEVIEGDRRVQVTEGPIGIEMTVSGDDDGEAIRVTVRARDAEDLRAKDADAFAIYERVAGTRGNIVLRNRRLAVPMPMPVPMPALPRPPQIPRPLPLPAPRGDLRGDPRPPATRLIPLAPEGGLNRPPADDLLELEGRIRRQMRGADVDAAHQDAVLDAMRMLRDIQAQGRMVAPDDIEAQIRRYNALSDALRQKLEDLNLPGPGDALPPPARARLGISVAAPEAIDAPGAAGGVLVTLVMPGGRGDKLGLKPGDVIRRVNGKSVDDPAALRRTLTDTREPLVLDVQRDGEPVVVKQKAP